MNFVNLPPEWNNTGTEPSQTLRDNGFTAGYKPPAAYFNWFWSLVSKCIAELQEKLNSLHTTAEELTTAKHTHSNKSTLDGISSTNVSHWNTAYSQSHTHSNKTVIDELSSSDITNWNSKAAGNHTHSQYAPINSPTFTGTPTAPTPDDNEESDQIATTLYVHRILEASYCGNLDDILAVSIDSPVYNLLCIGASNTPNGYNGILSCTMTSYDQSGYNRHKYTQSYQGGPGFKEYTRKYEYGTGWTNWVVVE